MEIPFRHVQGLHSHIPRDSHDLNNILNLFTSFRALEIHDKGFWLGSLKMLNKRTPFVAKESSFHVYTRTSYQINFYQIIIENKAKKEKATTRDLFSVNFWHILKLLFFQLFFIARFYSLYQRSKQNSNKQ